MPQSLLESLPTELLDIILDDEELEKEDIMAVGLASETLWMHALRHVEKQYMSTRAPFAGVEVAVTGTHLRDFPESFDADDMAKSSVGSLNIRRGRGGTIMPIARAVNWAALRTYEVVETSLEREWIPACHIHDTATLVISKKCFSGLLDELRSRCSSLYGGDLSAVWVLRNLTTKQYVECHPRAAWRGASGIINHPLADNMSIDDVLMLRTCWTKEALSGTNYRGQWAGHSFDLVPAVESGVETVPAGEWTAYTDEVVSQINGLREEIQREKMQIEQEKRRLQEELRIAEERRRRDEDERARAAEGTLQGSFPQFPST